MWTDQIVNPTFSLSITRHTDEGTDTHTHTATDTLPQIHTPTHTRARQLLAGKTVQSQGPPELEELQALLTPPSPRVPQGRQGGCSQGQCSPSRLRSLMDFHKIHSAARLASGASALTPETVTSGLCGPERAITQPLAKPGSIPAASREPWCPLCREVPGPAGAHLPPGAAQTPVPGSRL